MEDEVPATQPSTPRRKTWQQLRESKDCIARPSKEVPPTVPKVGASASSGASASGGAKTEAKKPPEAPNPRPRTSKPKPEAKAIASSAANAAVNESDFGPAIGMFDPFFENFED